MRRARPARTLTVFVRSRCVSTGNKRMRAVQLARVAFVVGCPNRNAKGGISGSEILRPRHFRFLSPCPNSRAAVPLRTPVRANSTLSRRSQSIYLFIFIFIIFIYVRNVFNYVCFIFIIFIRDVLTSEQRFLNVLSV